MLQNSNEAARVIPVGMGKNNVIDECRCSVMRVDKVYDLLTIVCVSTINNVDCVTCRISAIANADRIATRCITDRKKIYFVSQGTPSYPISDDTATYYMNLSAAKQLLAIVSDVGETMRQLKGA